MQKNDKFYTFLLSHTTKSKIYIRRVEVSKKLFHSSVLGIFFIIGIISLGALAISKIDNVNAKSNETASAATVLQAQPIESTPRNQPIEQKSINYSRPAGTGNYSMNSGGPASPFQLTLVETEEEESAMENQIRQIQATSNPSFVPTMWAHLGKINNEFGFRRNPFGGRTYEFHGGLDIDGERGDNVLAPANGVVTKAGWQGGYGNLIEIDHGNGLTTRYGHLSSIQIQVGDTIQRGQILGAVGSTGRSTGPHLHYELRLNDKPINPRRLLPPEPAELKKG